MKGWDNCHSQSIFTVFSILWIFFHLDIFDMSGNQQPLFKTNLNIPFLPAYLKNSDQSTFIFPFYHIYCKLL